MLLNQCGKLLQPETRAESLQRSPHPSLYLRGPRTVEQKGSGKEKVKIRGGEKGGRKKTG